MLVQRVVGNGDDTGLRYPQDDLTRLDVPCPCLRHVLGQLAGCCSSRTTRSSWWASPLPVMSRRI